MATTTADSYLMTAHDSNSGAFVRYSETANATPEARLKGFLHSTRLRAHSSRKIGGAVWEILELAEPDADARALESSVREGGEPLLPGSFTEALLAAHTPPPQCEREVVFVVTPRHLRPMIFTTVPCSSQQRASAETYVRKWIELSPALLPHPEPYGRATDSTAVDALVPGMVAPNVHKALGMPWQVWPCYPDGFTWVYPTGATGRLAIDFGRDRTIVRIRKFGE